jgi:zinc-binding alcohol dehydrogenase/oxidoreductase
MLTWLLDECPGTYSWGEIESPAVGPDDVAVRVVASALNHMDIWVTKGLPQPQLPHVPGCDVAGVIEAIGADVAHLAVGDEVVINPAVSPVEDIVQWGNDSPLGDGFQIYGEHRWGGHCEIAVAPARNVVQRPASRSWEECAAYPLAYLTAFRMLKRARLAAGETVLIVGIGSGVSCAALALAVHLGANVVVTSRSEAKRVEAMGMGAVAAYDSAESRWPVKADVVVESVGPATFDKAMRCMKPGARMVICGGTSGSTVELNLPRLFFKQFELIGSSMGSYQEFAALTRLVEAGLPIRIDRTYPLAEYPTALDRLTNGEQLGKIVLVR